MDTKEEVSQKFLGLVKDNNSDKIRGFVKKYLPTGFLDETYKDENGLTALHFASMYGNTEVIAALSHTIGNINMQDNSGRTPLYLACQYNQPKVVHLLLKLGAVVNFPKEGLDPNIIKILDNPPKRFTVFGEGGRKRNKKSKKNKRKSRKSKKKKRKTFKRK
jgi:ankyrin repeat protein